MNEEFLHYVWKNRLFNSSTLVSDDGDNIEILNVGQHNSNAGPDFFNAQIKINNTVWAGNVEIHLNSSDWLKHNHDKDKSYNNVILHIVENNDRIITRQNGEKITTVKLSYDMRLFKKYQDIINRQLWIPCQDFIQTVDKFTIDYWLNTLLIERMENKTDNIIHKLQENKNDWQEVCYQQIAKNFGYKINAEPFEFLAKSLPYKYLARHINNPFSTEALIFGQAGMLDEQIKDDDYYSALKNEFDFLRHKFNLAPIDKYQWKYLRLRPSNFPTIRLSQFADLLFKSKNIFSRIIECRNIDDIVYLFNNITTSDYWNSHYVFGKKSPAVKKTLGKFFINLILINSVVPLLFIYGKLHDNEDSMNIALAFLEEIEPENNSIIRGWNKLGFSPANAYYSQAMIELKNEYCTRKNCLRCMIGNKIII